MFWSFVNQPTSVERFESPWLIASELARGGLFRDAGNVWFDTAASPLSYGPDVWAKGLAALGAGRVLFGSDFPLNLYPALDEAPNLWRFLDEARAGGAPASVLGGNAARWFGRAAGA